jgi:hypothetical protein
MKQSTFADLEYAAKKKRTRREKFLGEMDRVVPWARWLALIEPHYPKAGNAGPRGRVELTNTSCTTSGRSMGPLTANA